MSMFPGAGARVYRNEAGEPLGWDYPSYDEPEYDDRDDGPDYCDEWLASTKYPGFCVRCGAPEDFHDETGEEEDPDAPILGQAVESIDPDPFL